VHAHRTQKRALLDGPVHRDARARRQRRLRQPHEVHVRRQVDGAGAAERRHRAVRADAPQRVGRDRRGGPVVQD